MAFVFRISAAHLGGVSAVVLALLLSDGRAQAQEPNSAKDLRAQLLDFGAEQDIRIFGLDMIESAPPREVVGESLVEKLDHLLSGYNYLLIPERNQRGSVLRILGQRPDVADTPLKQATVNTVRSGPHHLVQTVLTGRNGARTELMMMLDTGATTIVLPQSLAARLGFTPDQLKPGVARTAGGDVALQLGRLREVRVGTAHAADVPVAFIDDRQMGEYGLLGMSFLERFQMTLEEMNSRLTLESK